MTEPAHTRSASTARPRQHRRTRSAAVLAVLAALALLSPLLHCDLVPAATAHARAHETVTSAAGHHDRTGDPAGSHCTSHAVHCVSQVVLPARVPDPFTVVVPVALALATVAGPPRVPGAECWIRGPPVDALAAGGREILTHFCIARR